MSEQKGEVPLSDPSLHYFCVLCRKELTNSVRIIAKIKGETANYFNFCPPCLVNEKNSYEIQEYVVCRRLNEALNELDHLTAEEILHCMTEFHERGIEQIVFDSTIPEVNEAFDVYEQLNQHIFKQLGIGLDISRVKYDSSAQLPPIQRPNPANKKHLKALGYGWQRQQFNFQPEMIFGYLLGHLQEKDDGSEEQTKLRETIYNYYQKQKNDLKEVNEFLVNSMFLLGRRGIEDMPDVPAELKQLRALQDEIKEIITEVNNFTNNFEKFEVPMAKVETENGKQVNAVQNGQKEKKKKKHRHHHHHSSEEKGKRKDRSRSRDKKRKKNANSDNYSDDSSERIHRKLKKIQKNGKNLDQQNLSQSHLAQKNDQNDQTPLKRKRGRPKGSVNRPKTQEQVQEQIRLKTVSKMNLQSKREKLGKKKLQKRKNIDIQSSNKDSQQSV